MNNRNLPCKCGSKKKYKKCHLYQEQGFIKTMEGWVREAKIQLARTIK